jgi:hypothetical protein
MISSMIGRTLAANRRAFVFTAATPRLDISGMSGLPKTELAINCRHLANGAGGIEFQCNGIEPRSAASMALCLS